MKKPKFTLLLLLFTTSSLTFSQNVGIGTETPNESALLDLDPPNKDKGLLLPRLTEQERDGILNPAESLWIFNTDSQCYEGYSTIENKWFPVGCLEEQPEPVATFPEDYVHCGTPTEVIKVTSTTGKVWMDRNLGASQVATSSTDALSYGDLYQWGRFADGHQCRTSTFTYVPSSTDLPGNDEFIFVNAAPNDWRTPKNDNLWQGVNGINNPCPTGYRVPTSAELEEEMLSWGVDQSATSALASPLKLPIGGYRFKTADFMYIGATGRYWSSTINGLNAYDLDIIVGTNSKMKPDVRANGFSVRCIKD